jgi:hypothetical protein
MSINSSRFRPLSMAKRLFVRNDGRRPYRIRFGLFRNLILNLDLQHHMQIYLGLYEIETYVSIKSTSKHCSWLIDVGAGGGELCLYFLKNSRAEKIVGIEPQHSEIELLRSNLHANDEQSNKRMAIIQRFIGTKRQSDYIMLDSIEVDEHKRGFIKIDVEGGEMDVLESGKNLLSGPNVDLLIETHSAGLEESCLDWLKDEGYRCHIIRNAWWRSIVPEHRPIAHNRWIWATKAFDATAR